MSPNNIWFGILSTAVLKGVAGTCLGVFLYKITYKYSYKISKFNKITINFIEIISFLFLLALALLIFREPSKLNYLIFIPASLLISNMFVNKGIVSKFLSLKIFKYLGLISYEFYILQSPCSNIINCCFANISQPFITLIYFALNLILAIITYFLTQKGFKKCKKYITNIKKMY